jgi:glycosyltransferase involved in cell wall biosynthesis
MQAPVSVIIPCYNCSETIEKAVDSIAKQTLIPKEVILVNDNSPDQTIEILQNLQNIYGKEWIKIIDLKKNVGPGQARNIGWESADQNYLAFLDADDIWHPQKLEIQWSWMKNNPNVNFSGHPRLTYQENQDLNVSSLNSPSIDPKIISKLRLLTSNIFPPSSWLFKNSLSTKFKQDYYGEDYLCLLENFFGGNQMAFFNLPLCYCLRKSYSKGGLSSALWPMEKAELKAYQKIWKDDHISNLEYGLISLYSLMKYVRRIFLSFLPP